MSLCGDTVLLSCPGGGPPAEPADGRRSPVRESRTSVPASLLSGDESRWLLMLWLR